MPASRRLAVLVALPLLAACAAEPPSASLDPLAAGHLASHGAPGGSAEVHRQLAALRETIAPFHRFEAAVEAGYSARITPCWAHRALGAMGYHYARPALIDGAVSLLEPEVLMYEPGPGGGLRLVGVEYIVPIADWQGSAPPALLGQEMHPHSSLPIYKLHVWVGRNNPRGMFADWNPTVSCDLADETELFD